MSDLNTRLAAWEKARPAQGYDPKMWRQDDYGLLINWFHYGNRYSEYGWEIDRATPIACGVAGDFLNHRALRYQNNLGRTQALDKFLELLDRPLGPTTKNSGKRPG